MNRVFLTVGALLLGAALGTSRAAPLLSAQSIIVNPVGSPLQVGLWTDRDPSGVRTPTYRLGEPIHFYVTVNQDAYVYLFDVAHDGAVTQILPNHFDSGDNFVRSHTVRAFPGSGADFRFNVGGATGRTRVLAVATRTPLDLSAISSYVGAGPLASVTVQGQQELAQALSVVVTPLPDQAWGTSTLQFNVQPPAPAASGVVVQVAPTPPLVIVTAPAPVPVPPVPVIVQTPPPPPVVVVQAPPVVYSPPPRVVVVSPPVRRPVPPPPSVTTVPGQAPGVTVVTLVQLSPYVRAQAIQTRPGGYTFRSPDRVDQVFAYYDAELGRQGYRRVSSRVGREEASATYVTREGGRATLRVRKDRDRVDVSLNRS